MIKKREKLKLMQYIQISKNNDPLLLNLVNKCVLSDLLKLEMVLDFRRQHWTADEHQPTATWLLSFYVVIRLVIKSLSESSSNSVCPT